MGTQTDLQDDEHPPCTECKTGRASAPQTHLNAAGAIVCAECARKAARSRCVNCGREMQSRFACYAGTRAPLVGAALCVSCWTENGYG
jgi:hypothetical protein